MKFKSLQAAMREDNGLTHKNQQVFIIMNPIDLNLEPPILAVRKAFYIVYLDIYWHNLFYMYLLQTSLGMSLDSLFQQKKLKVSSVCSFIKFRDLE